MNIEYSSISTFTLEQLIQLQNDLRVMRNDPDDGEMTQWEKWVAGRYVDTDIADDDKICFSALCFDAPAEHAYDENGRLRPIIDDERLLMINATRFLEGLQISDVKKRMIAEKNEKKRRDFIDRRIMLHNTVEELRKLYKTKDIDFLLKLARRRLK